MKKCIALLPMKLHSERIPDKNFKIFEDKPLFYWVLETLISMTSVDRVIINTDGVDKLKGFGLINNEKIILRSRRPELRGDMVSMNKIIADDLAFAGDNNYLMTHTTNPLIGLKTFEDAILCYQEALAQGFDSLFSVNKYHSRFYFDGLKPINHDPQNLVRTQDLKPVYEENSCFYIFNSESFSKTNARIGEKPMLYETPALESVDIDDYSTWKKAEICYQILKNS